MWTMGDIEDKVTATQSDLERLRKQQSQGMVLVYLDPTGGHRPGRKMAMSKSLFSVWRGNAVEAWVNAAGFRVVLC